MTAGAGLGSGETIVDSRRCTVALLVGECAVSVVWRSNRWVNASKWLIMRAEWAVAISTAGCDGMANENNEQWTGIASGVRTHQALSAGMSME